MVNYFHPKLSFRNNVTTNAAQPNHYILNEFQYEYMRLLQREQIAFLLIYHLGSGYFTRTRRVGTKMFKYLGQERKKQ